MLNGYISGTVLGGGKLTMKKMNKAGPGGICLNPNSGEVQAERSTVQYLSYVASLEASLGYMRKEKRKKRMEGKCKQCLCLEVLLFIDMGEK